jgi:hypothetical protein
MERSLPSPDRLARVRWYALRRSVELAARDRVAGILRDELPELPEPRALAIADRIVGHAAEDRLKAAGRELLP